MVNIQVPMPEKGPLLWAPSYPKLPVAGSIEAYECAISRILGALDVFDANCDKHGNLLGTGNWRLKAVTEAIDVIRQTVSDLDVACRPYPDHLPHRFECGCELLSLPPRAFEFSACDRHGDQMTLLRIGGVVGCGKAFGLGGVVSGLELLLTGRLEAGFELSHEELTVEWLDKEFEPYQGIGDRLMWKKGVVMVERLGDQFIATINGAIVLRSPTRWSLRRLLSSIDSAGDKGPSDGSSDQEALERFIETCSDRQLVELINSSEFAEVGGARLLRKLLKVWVALADVAYAEVPRRE